MKKISCVIILWLCSLFCFSQNNKSVLLMNGTAHVGNGRIIENAFIVLKDGKIQSIGSFQGAKINTKIYDTVIELSGKHVYPALISCNSILGLQEAEAIHPTSDYNETGYINPHVRSLIAYNTDSKIIPTVKTNGVLYTQCTPRAGLISGSSSVFALEGWNWEDAVLKADDGIHINFPKSIQRKGWWAEPAPSEKNTRFDDELSALNKFFEDASSYCKNSEAAYEINLRFEAMRNVFAGKQNLYLHANYVKDIILAVNFAKKFNIQQPVIVGGKDSWRCTQFLKENKIPVMLTRINDLPDLPEDDVDIVYRTPYLLQKDSVLFCLQMEGDMEAMQSRNLPFIAGEAAAYGLTKEEALQSISLNAARILKIDNLIGSLEEGKTASLVVSEGDLLDMKTNKVVLAFIAGKQVNLINEQQLLYEKYKTKYGLK